MASVALKASFMSSLPASCRSERGYPNRAVAGWHTPRQTKKDLGGKALIWKRGKRGRGLGLSSLSTLQILVFFIYPIVFKSYRTKVLEKEGGKGGDFVFVTISTSGEKRSIPFFSCESEKRSNLR